MESSAPKPQSDGARRSGEFLSFHLDAEEYGIDILKVPEIRGYEQPTRMGNAPPDILGVGNLRGVIVFIIGMVVDSVSNVIQPMVGYKTLSTNSGVAV